MKAGLSLWGRSPLANRHERDQQKRSSRRVSSALLTAHSNGPGA